MIREGCELRLHDPATGRKLENARETTARIEAERHATEMARRNVALSLELTETRQRVAEAELELARARLQRLEITLRLNSEKADLLGAENDRLRRELDELRKRLGEGS